MHFKNSDTILIADYLTKKGNLIGFTLEEKLEFVNICKSNFFFYDPFVDLLINPINSRNFRPRELQGIFSESNNELQQTLRSEFPTDDQVDKAFEKLNFHRKTAYNLLRISSDFKYLGVIVGGLLGYFVDKWLGIAVGFYLIYFDYKIFYNVNAFVNNIQGEFMTANNWRFNQLKYYFSTLIFFIIAIVGLYFFKPSFWLIFSFCFVHEWVLVDPLVRYINSSGYKGKNFVMQLDQELERQNQNREFLKNYPFGINILNIDYENDILCKYKSIEKQIISYEMQNELKSSKFLFVFSKERIHKDEIKLITETEIFMTNLIRVENESVVEFYFERISNRPETSYIIVTKKDSMEYYRFEGAYSNNILKSYHDNGKIEFIHEYRYGVKHGKSLEYHDNGARHFECVFENGFLVPDFYTCYYEDGKIMMKGAIRNIEDISPDNKVFYDPDSKHRIGLWEFFDESGKLIKAKNYLENGNIEIIKSSRDGDQYTSWL